jgi:carboxypeptidase C (cathepsin A)
VIGICQDRILSLRFTNFSTLSQAFFKEHPQFAKNDFYITGESYAGHYIPAFAARVHQGNKAKEGLHINLKVVLRFNQSWLLNLTLSGILTHAFNRDLLLVMG